MKFLCKCGENSETFKDFIDHLRVCQPKSLKRYEIKNMKQGGVILAYSLDPETIIQINGWTRDDCKVREI